MKDVSDWLRWLLLWTMVAAAAGSSTAALADQGALAGETHPDAEIVTAPIIVDGRVLLRVRGVSSFPAADRAAAIADRIARLASDPALNASEIHVVEAGDHSAIMLGERPIMVLFDADARIEQVERDELVEATAKRIGVAITDYRRERSREVVLRHAVEAAAAVLALTAVVALLIWLTRRLNGLLEKHFRNRISSLGIQSFQIVRAERIWYVLGAIVSALRLLAIVVASVGCLDFVLNGFPWTRSFARELTGVVVRPLVTMGEAFLAYFPDLVFLVILGLLVRFILRLIRVFFNAVAHGSVTLENFEVEWAWPTYKLVRVTVLIFAVIIAYPYIPGSDSAAFKGVSLLVGVVVSLGSSSVIANLIAGLMITYRRAFKVGDRVMIGDVVGDVVDVRLQVTHLRTLKNEEVTIANSLILNGYVVNYSSLAEEHGLILHGTVGIGYETPWRQVEAMLLMAARRTPGLLAEPPAFVLYKGLGDFCITYEINAYCRDARTIPSVNAELQRNILDIFNEYGVQIMTPNYVTDTPQPKLVEKDQWYVAPAEQERADAAAVK
ncbi:mechanosensitive ion channel domain-containing protein [Candidatus Accumulibacter sp. ACC003]|uniref:mechanosensitive ion channel family protein n=1 Tax=Candidatus Accumulibacter sp. ACC003 TaxID=2823334 RepID=UPI0025BC40FD|nr:mechanosensitive ion channel domain-containing protein [Candidatus Accumulibacter sp. ACC003]